MLTGDLEASWASVDDDRPARAGQHRVAFELHQVGTGVQRARYAHDGPDQCVEVGGWAPAVSDEQWPGGQALEGGQDVLGIDGEQQAGGVAQQLNQGAADTQGQEPTHRRLPTDADKQLGDGVIHELLHQHLIVVVEAHGLNGGTYRGGVSQPHGHTACLGLVCNPGGLDHDRGGRALPGRGTGTPTASSRSLASTSYRVRVAVGSNGSTTRSGGRSRRPPHHAEASRAVSASPMPRTATRPASSAAASTSGGRFSAIEATTTPGVPVA